MMKLHLTENAITDIRNTKILNKKDIIGRISEWFDVNWQDCTLKEIPKPNSEEDVEDSPYPIIGANTEGTLYGKRRGRDDLHGLVAYCAWWNGDFVYTRNCDNDDYSYGCFKLCNKFYIIEPINPETYKNAWDIQKGRERTYNVSIDDHGNIIKYDKNKKLPKTNQKIRNLTQSELDNYDIKSNQEKYKKLLAKNHLSKYIKQYDELCNMYKEFLHRITDIGVVNGKWLSKSKMLDEVQYYLQLIDWVNDAVEGIENSAPYTSEETLVRRIKEAMDYAEEVDKVISEFEENEE